MLLLLACAAVTGCGGGSPAVTVSTAPTGPVTPTVTLTLSPGSAIPAGTDAFVTVALHSGSTSVPTGTVILSSGSYASFPLTLSSGKAITMVPTGVLGVGSSTLTAAFTSGDTTAFNSASGSTSVSVSAPTAAPSVIYSDYRRPTAGNPFRAVPLSNGDVLVSVTNTDDASSGIQLFQPSDGTLQPGCVNKLRPAFQQEDGVGVLGITLLPTAPVWARPSTTKAPCFTTSTIF